MRKWDFPWEIEEGPAEELDFAHHVVGNVDAGFREPQELTQLAVEPFEF
jgi:hypothetical protein